VYRPRVLVQIERLLDRDRLRPFHLFARAKTLEVPVDQLRQVDPELGTLENLNRPEDYFRALQKAGLAIPEGVAEKLKPPGSSRPA
jgi:molybdopterin-guanine dinucleotide biosynthesis protein A